MIHPSNLDTLSSVLKPPRGYIFDYGVFTTYSLHLDLILTLPMYLSNSNNESVMQMKNAKNSSEMNYGHIVDMIDTYKSKMSIFTQVGQIKTSSLASSKSSKLYGLLSDMITEVTPNKNSSFHPKLWLLKYKNKDEISYRLVVLSKNLTNSKDWDIVSCFDGKVQEKQKDNINENLWNFLKYLDKKSPLKFEKDEIKSLKWDKNLDGLSLESLNFLGINGSKQLLDVPQRGTAKDPVIVFSPFISKNIIDYKNIKLITREEEITDEYENLKTIFSLAFEPVQTTDEEGSKNLSGDIHAKIYIYKSYSTHIFLGSSNSSNRGLGNKNVEVLVELKGSKKIYDDIDNLYFNEKSKLLNPIVLEDISSIELQERQNFKEIEEKLRIQKDEILETKFDLEYDEKNKTVVLKNSTLILSDKFSLKVQPVSQSKQTKNYDFMMKWENQKVIDITPFFSFGLSYYNEDDGKSQYLEFVMKLELSNSPSDYVQEIKAYADEHSSDYFLLNLKHLLATDNELLTDLLDEKDLTHQTKEQKEQQKYYNKKNIQEDIMDMLMLSYSHSPLKFCMVVRKILSYKSKDEEYQILKNTLKNLGETLCMKVK